MKKVLITGVAGFVGTQLSDYLLTNFSDTLEVHGLYHATPPKAKLGLISHQLDLANQVELAKLLGEIKPTYIFHLAARSFVGPAIAKPSLTLNTNLNVTLALFEAIRMAGLVESSHILNAGSSDQYGFVRPEDSPITEQIPFRPGNPYAVSKITQEMLGYQYFRSYGLHIVNTRAFNHLGPGQSAELATGAFARQIAQAEIGQIPPIIRVGNLEAQRDYTDVRDVVRAYWLALNTNCRDGEAYNICSGHSYSIGEILNRLIAMAKIPLEIQNDPARMRPSDVPLVQGSYVKFQQATDWQPQIGLQASLADLLNYWREQVQPRASQCLTF